MKHTGWRKPTPGLGVAEQHARAGERVAVPKSRAFVAIKRVGTHIGLKASDLMLLDTLGAFTQPQDWEEGSRPIVWASNAYLIEQTGFSLSALKRHARSLVEAGVVAFQDSPNGKRWGCRDAGGHIIEAYGFDLAPLSARVAEFEALHIEIKAERARCQRLRRQITVARRMIRARIEAALHAALNGSWARYLELFEGFLTKLPRAKAASDTLENVLEEFQDLQRRVEVAYLETAANGAENRFDEAECVVGQTKKMDPTGAIYAPHIQFTKKLSRPVVSNSSRNKKAAVEPRDIEESSKKKFVSRKQDVALDVPTVMHACPEFASWAHNLGGYIKDWGDLYRIAGQLRPMIGVPEEAWLAAQEEMGKQAAAAALALVFDKHSTGEITSPSGYLRGMVEKAGAGELHLERSFYGRLSRMAA